MVAWMELRMILSTCGFGRFRALSGGFEQSRVAGGRVTCRCRGALQRQQQCGALVAAGCGGGWGRRARGGWTVWWDGARLGVH